MSTDAALHAPRIDVRFTELLDPLDPETYRELEAQLMASGGPRDALIVWKERGALLDGRHRLRICQQHGLPFRVEEVSLPDEQAARDWIARNQLARRNLTPSQRSYWRGKLLLAQRKDPRATLRVGKQESPLSHDETAGETSLRISAQTGVSRATVQRDGQFAAAVDAVVAAAPAADRSKVQAAILTGTVPMRSRDVLELARGRPLREDEMTFENLVAHGKALSERRRPQKPTANPNAPFITRGPNLSTLTTYVDARDGKTYLDRVQLTCGHWHEFIRQKPYRADGTIARSFACRGCGSGTRKAHMERVTEAQARANFEAAIYSPTRRDCLFRLVRLAIALLSLQPSDARAEKIRDEMSGAARSAGLFDERERGSTTARAWQPKREEE